MTEDERTTALGLFHYAHAYAEAANNLAEIPREAFLADAPMRFLYSHAAELYLKAYLRLRGVPVAQLRSRSVYGHDFSSLIRGCREHGLELSEDDEASLMVFQDAITDRYIENGSRRVLSTERMRELSLRLHLEVGVPIYSTARVKRPLPTL